MARVLISGIPGTGKTTLGEYMESELGYLHVDMEAGKGKAIRRLEDDRAGFLGDLATHENVVITWGFKPYHYRDEVNDLVKEGFQPFWLDGDRAVAFGNFMKREDHNPKDELNYYTQMHMILATRIVETLGPTIINPFDDTGAFRPTEQVANEIVGKLAPTSPGL